jgi:hypothetical protein
MRRLVDAAARTFGGALVRLALAGVAAGLLALLAGVALGRAEASLGALLSSWLFFTGLAAGGVAVSATLRVAQASWAGQISPVAEAPAAFFPVSLGVLGVLLASARAWVPGLAAEGARTWMLLAARVLASALVLVWAARRYLARVADDRGVMRAAIVYLVAYVLALSLWAIDLVMGLAPFASSTVVPPFYFIGALLSGVAWITLFVSVRAARGVEAPTAASRYDLAKLLFGFSIFWFYLLWSGFLPVWYANIPEETGLLLLRWEGGYRIASIAVVLSVFFLPFWILMPGSAKRLPVRVASGAALILAGLAGERFLLVLPSLHADGALPAVVALGVTAALGGAFLLTTGAALAGPKGPTADPGAA